MSKIKNNKKNILVENFIVFFLLVALLLYKSIINLSEIFTYGILKKEVLTNKSSLGFDIKIKIKK